MDKIKINRTQKDIDMIKGLASKDPKVREESKVLLLESIRDPILKVINETPPDAFEKVWEDVCNRMTKDGIKIPELIITDSNEIHPRCS